jgi:hypothetical protein
MYAQRRRMAVVLFVIAVVAVAAFGLGVTRCIDWGGASAPPHVYERPAAPSPVPL